MNLVLSCFKSTDLPTECCHSQPDARCFVPGTIDLHLSLLLMYASCGVAQVLLSFGSLRPKLTGLQWSYAKLGGPSFMNLMAQCTNLRSLSLRLWYQDHTLQSTECNLGALTGLVHLEVLEIEKRPPFQQQLSATQSAGKVCTRMQRVGLPMSRIGAA